MTATVLTEPLMSPTVIPCPDDKRGNNRFEPRDEGQVYCNSTWDTVTCWPTTRAGDLSIMPCPSFYNDVHFDTSTNATKMCYGNGQWQSRANYNSCQPLSTESNTEAYNSIIQIIYYAGFTTSTAALVVALFIFLYYKSLRCLRNTIHCHLIITFIARNVLWLIMNIVVPQMDHAVLDKDEASRWICKVMVVFYNYLQTANFFWMLVEGVYLHTMIVWTFTIEKVRFLYYAILGWGVPALIVFVWAMVRAFKANKSCWLPSSHTNESTYYDYIYIGPILLVLLVNSIFLASIVWVLITKLRASNTLHIRQYSRKAVKATLILLPLLGITYVVFITPPSSDKTTEVVFAFINAILQSLQGLAVAIFYCFLNGEVRTTIQTRFSRWQDGRSITTRYSRASIATNEHLGLTKTVPTDQYGSDQPNGRPSISSTNKDHQKNNNINGVNHMNTPMLRIGDEAL